MQKFSEDVLTETSGKIMVKFGASWCCPCKIVAPVLEEMVQEGQTIYDVDVDSDLTSTAKFGIRGIPTYIVFENGKEIKRESGVKNKAQFEELLN